MYREQNYIFSFTFVYKPKMASLVKITKKHKKKKKKKKELQFNFMDAEDFTPVHLSCELLFFPLSLDTNGIIFLHSYISGKGTELLKFKCVGGYFFFRLLETFICGGGI